MTNCMKSSELYASNGNRYIAIETPITNVQRTVKS